MSTNAEIDRNITRGKLVKRLLLIFLVLTNGVLFFTTYQFKSEKELTAIELESKEELVLEIEETLKATETELIKYQNLSAELNKLLVKANEQIEKLRAEIEELKKNPAKNEELKRKLDRLQKTAEKYLEQINSLVETNQKLSAENEKLKQKVLAEQSISNTLRSEKEQLEAELGIQAKPKIENIIIIGINVNHKGEERQTFNVDQIHKLKLCFDVAPNVQMQKNDKEIILQLITPDGVVAGNDETGSGTFKKVGSGKPYKYTSKIIVKHDTMRKNVCMYSERRNKYDPGTYVVELYYDGFMIGTSEFELQ